MKKYILVTGGELYNKGAQAMTFITVDQIAVRFPEYKVVLLSNQDVKRSELEKANYKFEIMPFPSVGETLSLCTGILKKRYLARENGAYFKKYKDLFSNAAAMLDISGYALGSNWGASTARAYLRRIKLAKHFGVNVYLLPQSFGPFEFKGKGAFITNMLIKHYLKYPKCIMAREDEGKQLLEQKYGLSNVIKTPDLVLQARGIDLQNVYVTVPEISPIDIADNSVAVIPNSKNNKYGNEDAVLQMYQRLITTVLEKGKNVYLIYHAVEDLKICRKLKDMFFSNIPAVTVVERELNCIEFEDVIDKFDFVVGSRYHSIVHSYKEAVPAVILGWAIKYRELAKCFGQEKYCFDVKDADAHNDIIMAVEAMCIGYKAESKKISTHLSSLQEKSIYDLIKIKN